VVSFLLASTSNCPIKTQHDERLHNLVYCAIWPAGDGWCFLADAARLRPINLRALGIVLVGTFATLLALKDSSSLTAAMGILGAIVGYFFGIKDRQ